MKRKLPQDPQGKTAMPAQREAQAPVQAIARTAAHAAEQTAALPAEQMTAHAAEQAIVDQTAAQAATPAPAQPESRTDPRQHLAHDPAHDPAQEIRPDPQQRLRELLESGASVRRALARLEEERRRLMREISGIEAASRQLQDQLPPELRSAAHEQYLAAELRRLDREIPGDAYPGVAGISTASAPSLAYSGAHAGPAGGPITGPVTGAPGGIERRTTPRPAPIPLPAMAMQVPEEPGLEPDPESAMPRGLLGRARRALLRGRPDA